MAQAFVPERTNTTSTNKTPTTGSTPASTGWLLPLAVLVIGMFMSVLDVTIVNVAVPAIQKDFGGSLTDVLRIATAYTLTLGVVVPVTSWLGDRFGLSRVYLVALLGFAAGSTLCGLAWNLEVLVAFRILQAVPGGLLPVVTLTIVYKIVPREKIVSAMGLYGLGIVFAPAIGPVLGGYLVQYLDWRLVFFINVPIGIAGAVAAYMFVPRVAGGAVHRFDFAGFATIAVGLFSVLLAASEGQDWGWTSYKVLTGAALTGSRFAEFYQRAEHLRLEVLATSYSNLFLLTALLSGAGAVLALLLRSGPAPNPTPTAAPPADVSARVTPDTITAKTVVPEGQPTNGYVPAPRRQPVPALPINHQGAGK